MATSSRRLSNKARKNKASQTPGKTKGPSCQKSPLKNWGMNARPHRMTSAGLLGKYSGYCTLCDKMNNQRAQQGTNK